MAKVVFRQKAVDDLNNIWNYTLKNGLKIKPINIIPY